MEICTRILKMIQVAFSNGLILTLNLFSVRKVFQRKYFSEYSRREEASVGGRRWEGRFSSLIVGSYGVLPAYKNFHPKL